MDRYFDFLKKINNVDCKVLKDEPLKKHTSFKIGGPADLFIDIHGLDEDDDIWNPDNYIKANPFIAATKEGLEILITDSNTARAMGGMELRDFLIKSLNLWVKNYDTVYVNPDNWKRRIYGYRKRRR